MTDQRTPTTLPDMGPDTGTDMPAATAPAIEDDAATGFAAIDAAAIDHPGAAPEAPTSAGFVPEPTLDDSGPRRDAKTTLKEEAGKLGSQAAEKARSFAGDGKARASGALDEFSKMMDDAAATVDAKLGEQYGQYARSAAQQIGGFADTLRNRDVDDLIEDARVFVRKSPAIAIGTAAALGFVLARIIKAGVDGVADASDPAGGKTPRA